MISWTTSHIFILKIRVVSVDSEDSRKPILLDFCVHRFILPYILVRKLKFDRDVPYHQLPQEESLWKETNVTSFSKQIKSFLPFTLTKGYHTYVESPAWFFNHSMDVTATNVDMLWIHLTNDSKLDLFKIPLRIVVKTAEMGCQVNISLTKSTATNAQMYFMICQI